MKKLQSREEELKKVHRYGTYTDTMFFRANLWVHSKRVALWCDYICGLLKNQGIQINTKKVLDLAMIHDDEEIITGDIVAQDKLQFTQEQQKKYDNDCQEAFSTLKHNYIDDFDSFNYAEYLNIVENKVGVEYMVVDLADKLDAHCECSHEIKYQNFHFFKNVFLEDHGIVTPFNFTFYRTQKRLDLLLDHYNLKNLFVLGNVDIIDFYENGIPKNIKNHHSGYEIYDIWIKLQFDSNDNELIDCLTIQKEFLK